MKSAIAVLLLFTLSFACSGDCFACHKKLEPSIQSDERHKPMIECINCHKDDTSTSGECGSDCFDCHKPEAVMKNNVEAHRVIMSCIQCHTGIQQESFLKPPENFSTDSLFK